MSVTAPDGATAGSGRPATFVCEHAWLPPGWAASEVVIEVVDGRFTRVEPGGVPPEGAERLAGLVLPGLANAHSHAFHRALRGHTHGRRGSFWTWREMMYDVAARLDPDRYHALARATFAEMALAGFSSVGEFHYLHHGAEGAPYSDPNEVGEALIAAAREAGLRITLLDTCYLASGPGNQCHQGPAIYRPVHTARGCCLVRRQCLNGTLIGFHPGQQLTGVFAASQSAVIKIHRWLPDHKVQHRQQQRERKRRQCLPVSRWQLVAAGNQFADGWLFAQK